MVNSLFEPVVEPIERERILSQILHEVLTANTSYAESFGDKASLTIPPRRRLAILTCMDARLDPAQFAGLQEGDAHIIRNAGGRASDDAIRSLIISHKLLGTNEWLVIHHTDCGMLLFTNKVMHDLLSESLATAEYDGTGWRNPADANRDGTIEGQYINWLTIHDEVASIVEDVQRIRQHPLVPGDIAIYGFLFDVQTGRLIEIPEATAAGRVS